MSTPAIIRHRRDTAANWTSNNPVLEAGQLGLETDTLKIKFGDGTTAWNSLSYASGGGSGVTDGDKGDITVSSSGATWTIDNGAVTYAKMQDVSAASKLIGRGSASGSGDPQEITIGTNLTMSGTTLSAAGSISGSTGSTDNAIIRADGTGGSTIQGSVPTIDDNGKILADAFAFDTTPTTTGGTGVIIWDSTESAPSVGFNANVLGKLGVDSHVQVYNQTGSTIAKRKVVRQSGSSGTRLKVDLALADGDPNSATTIGITAESISNNSSGFIITAGLLTGVNTIAFTEGDVLWLSSTSSGDITNVRPTQPAHGVRLGYCIKSSAGAGIIYVDILNGLELEELHDVLITSPADNSFLVYESSSSLWKDEGPSDARTSLGLGTLATQSGTFSGTSSGTNTGDQTITLTGDVTGSGTGSFAATIASGVVDTTNLGGDITTAGKALLDDADAAAQRTTLGLGTLATQSGTFSGTSSGTNTGDQTITLTGDVTGSGTGSFSATIANDAVTNAKLANVSTATIKGRVSASTGDPEDLTGTQATTLLDTFTSSLKGLAPSSGGGTTNFLRADGTWAAPAGGGTSAQVDTYTTTGTVHTWSKPSGAKMVQIIAYGAGGGGGGGAGNASAVNRTGGGGGGAGACSKLTFSADDIPSSLYVIVGAAGTGGASQTVGVAGGNSTVATNNSNPPSAATSLCLAGGGGGGGPGSTGDIGGGGGGGTNGQGTTFTGATTVAGGLPAVAFTNAAIGGQGGGGGYGSTAYGGRAEWGGGGGGNMRAAGDFRGPGGGSMYGGGGGGCGTGLSGGGAAQGGTGGGPSGSYSGGAATASRIAVLPGGDGQASATGTAGLAGGTTYPAGGGGGGGGANNAGTGYTGGAGGFPCGGGGGGGASSSTGGTGGAGANGEVIIITLF
jgi:hypothetical protein